jgi:hypothetical protein
MMRTFTRLHRHLDPSESLGELIFGLIMVLTFTLGARLLDPEAAADGSLIVGAIGCNVAWGIIDAVLFVLGRFYDRHRIANIVRALRKIDDLSALAIIDTELASDLARKVDDSERERFYLAVAAAARHHPLARVRVLPEDVKGAVVVFFLVLGTALPAGLPFLLIEDGELALRSSNALLVVLLFFVGYRWGQHVGARPWLAGWLVMGLGASLALLAIPLGG